MAAITDLFQLVKSLSPAEKRYTRLFASKHLPSNNSRYLKLFDALLELHEYNEEEISAKSEEAIEKFSASDKIYLYRFLLKSLRNFHEEGTIDSHLKEMLINASLLFERRLYQAGIKELERAKKTATKYERHTILLEILQMQVSILIERNPKKPSEELAALREEMSSVLNMLNEFTQLRMLQKEVFIELRSQYQLRDHTQNQQIIKWAEDADRFSASYKDQLMFRHTFLNVMAKLSLYEGKFSLACTYYEEALKLWEKHPDRIKEEIMPYMKLLANYLSACHGSNSFDKIPALLVRLNELNCRSQEEKAEQFQNGYFIELLYRMNTDRFGDFDDFVSRVDKGLEQFKTKINEARMLAFLFNISTGYFIAGEWRKSLTWMQRLINREKTSHRKDFQRTARLLRLLLYYELDKRDALEYELINVERYLRQQKSWFVFESSVVRFFKGLLETDESELPDRFSKISLQLKSVISEKSSASLPGSTEIQLWIEHHITGRSLRELVKESS